ncbi:malonic semialdehyde reductase RutE [compost metagenome]
MSQPRSADHAIAPLFLDRRSPRAFRAATIDDDLLLRLFEAARWAPSANNAQPWRFIYAKQGSASWPRLFGLLNEKNQAWAARASALVVLLSRTIHLRAGASEATPLRSHSLDAGAAWASLAFQAEHLGWQTHAIGGFDRERARSALGIPEDYRIEVAIAIGKRADPASLSPEQLERERPTQRRPLRELVAEGRFAFDAP